MVLISPCSPPSWNSGLRTIYRYDGATGFSCIGGGYRSHFRTRGSVDAVRFALETADDCVHLHHVGDPGDQTCDQVGAVRVGQPHLGRRKSQIINHPKHFPRGGAKNQESQRAQTATEGLNILGVLFGAVKEYAMRNPPYRDIELTTSMRI